MKKWIKYFGCCIVTGVLMRVVTSWGITAILIVYTLGLIYATRIFVKDKEEKK